MQRTLNELQTPPLPLEKFTWNPKTKTLSAEASDFGPARDGRWWLGRLWNDACDAGITIRSHHTGKEERFYEVEAAYAGRGEDAETVALNFRPVDPECRVQLVTIFND